LVLEKEIHLDVHHFNEVAEKITAHETKLAELSAAVEHAHTLELEHQQQAAEETLNELEQEAVEEEQHHVEEETHVENHLPEVLIHRAQEVIARAESDLAHHLTEGRAHLTAEFEQEISTLKHLEAELLVLEKEIHLDVNHFNEVQEKILTHENRLIELSVAVEYAHKLELEQQHQIDEETVHHEEEQPAYQDGPLSHALIVRARELLAKAREIVNAHRAAGGEASYNFNMLAYEVDLIIHFEQQLVVLAAHTSLLAQELHAIEAQLMAHENRVAELVATLGH